MAKTFLLISVLFQPTIALHMSVTVHCIFCSAPDPAPRTKEQFFGNSSFPAHRSSTVFACTVLIILAPLSLVIQFSFQTASSISYFFQNRNCYFYYFFFCPFFFFCILSAKRDTSFLKYPSRVTLFSFEKYCFSLAPSIYSARKELLLLFSVASVESHKFVQVCISLFRCFF